MRTISRHRQIVFPVITALVFCALVSARSQEPPTQGKAALVYIGGGKGIHFFRLQPT